MTAVLDTGDEVSVSVKSKNSGVLTTSDKKKLLDDIQHRILPIASDTLYFRVRYNEKDGKSKGKVDSNKVKTMQELFSVVDKYFEEAV